MTTGRTGKPQRTPRCVPVIDNNHEGRPLVKIAPKATLRQSLPKSDDKHPEAHKLKPRRRCPVPRCPIRNCRLQTHRAWNPPPTTGESTPQHAADATCKTLSIAPVIVQEPHELTIVRGGVDGMPYIPLASLRRPVFKGLLHRFLLDVWDRIGILLAPPARSVLEAERWKVQKSKMLIDAKEAPAYLLNFVVSAYMYLILREDHTTQGKDLFQLQVELVKHLRQKLDNFTPADVDQLVCIVLTLVILEVMCGRSHQTLFSHRQAMIHLVDSRGGLHNLGRTIPYVMNLDRLISLYIDQPPVYCPWIDPNLGIQRAARHPRLYGCFFEDDARAPLIHSDIRWYCSAACRAMEILEGENWYFSPGQICDSSELWYFYFLRDQIVSNYAHLNARFSHENSISRCVMLAAKIVEYSVLVDRFVITLPHSLADRVRDLLCNQDLDEQWQRMEDVLRWVLWVLIIYPSKWNGHAWALGVAKTRLDLEHGTIWPSPWVDLEMQNVRRFVWSKRWADRDFVRVCSEL